MIQASSFLLKSKLIKRNEKTTPAFIMTTKTLKNGLHTEYYDNGQINSVANYIDGKEDGKRILQNEKTITFHDENREAQIKELAELILKNAKK